MHHTIPLFRFCRDTISSCKLMHVNGSAHCAQCVIQVLLELFKVTKVTEFHQIRFPTGITAQGGFAAGDTLDTVRSFAGTFFTEERYGDHSRSLTHLAYHLTLHFPQTRACGSPSAAHRESSCPLGHSGGAGHGSQGHSGGLHTVG